MLTGLFWDIATSTPALGFDGLILLVALVVGWFPLLKYLPGIGAYVPVVRLVAALIALLLCFLVGFRVADEREEAKNLRATIEAQRADLDNSRKSRADEAARAAAIEGEANAQHEQDAEYIRRLEANDACKFDPFRAPGGVQHGPGRAAAAGSPPRAAAAAR